MGRGKDSKPRKKRELKLPGICPKHGTRQVRRISGDLRCRACYNEQSVAYRAANPEKYKESQRRQYLKDPRGYMLSRAKSRACLKGVEFSITKEDIEIPEFCPVLGIPLIVGTGDKTDNSPSLDRIIPCLGYVEGNVQVISDRANRIKSDASIEDLRKIIHYLQENEKCSS